MSENQGAVSQNESQAQVDVRSVWNKVVDQVKLKVIHPTLWRSLEMAVPIAVDGGEFIVGFAPGDFHMSGHLTTSQHKNAIESALRSFTGQQFALRIVEGDTLQDWQQAKVKDAHAKTTQEAAIRKREEEAAVVKSWEGLLEQVSRTYAATPLRQLPQVRARYIKQILRAISEAMAVLMPDGRSDELTERSLARVIDKVATLTETPSAIIALELERVQRNSL